MTEAVDQLLDEARRKCDLQVDRLNGFRNGAATMLAAGGIISGVFGVAVTRHISVPRLFFLVVALVAFVGVLVMALVIYWPMPNWDEGEKLGTWLDRARTHDGLMTAFPFNLAWALNDAYGKNASRVTRDAKLFRWACGLLAAEVVCWCISALLK